MFKQLFDVILVKLDIRAYYKVSIQYLGVFRDEDDSQLRVLLVNPIFYPSVF